MECVPLGGNGWHWLKFEIQALEAEMHELTDEQQLHAERQKRKEMALAEALEEAAARHSGVHRDHAAAITRSSLPRHVPPPPPRAMFDPPPALCLGGTRMECVPLSGNGCANGPPMGCYNGQWDLPEWVQRAVVNAVEVSRAGLGLKLARIAEKQKRVAKSLANKQARLAEVEASPSVHSLANLELHSPRTMPSKRAASEVTQAVVKGQALPTGH